MKISTLRWTILTAAFVILLFGAYGGLYFGYFLPTFSCCWVRARAGTCFMLTLQRTLGMFTWESMFILLKQFIFFSLLVILLGRAWCGWLCPLGFVQDLLDRLRQAVGLGYVRFSEKLRGGLAWIKWAFLAVAVLLPIWVAFPVMCPAVALGLQIPFCQLCPGKYILPLCVGNPDRISVNYENGTHVVMSILGLTFSMVALLGALIKRRFWCGFCPLGLILGWYRKISFIKLKKNDAACTRCEICYNVCPSEITEVFRSQGKTDVTTAECMLCLKCVENCPEEGALKATYLGKTIYRSSPGKFFIKRGVNLTPTESEGGMGNK
ncbi:4Fe-4S binding protein [Desulfosarcina ovata]|uniref:4Fe-4S ferredoxin n=1 Tax=Desulfosarcina ovata subsp. ovata TaxID=2752305 RepID=A0A5K8AAT1_9BACT|nr:4Fe-4S binding protein [Desulfosarcina ovata]BBO89641.1 4Fe-4S ferredoxin [Desulfosarcina ovata subsp. ovata]